MRNIIENNISLFQSISMNFMRIFDYKGRSTRREFFTFWGLFIALNIIVNIITISVLNNNDNDTVFMATILINIAFYVAMFLLWLPLSIRRLRDAGYSPLWMLSLLIPFIFPYTSKYIKPEYADEFMLFYTVTFWVILLGMLVLYAQPSKK